MGAFELRSFYVVVVVVASQQPGFLCFWIGGSGFAKPLPPPLVTGSLLRAPLGSVCCSCLWLVIVYNPLQLRVGTFAKRPITLKTV